MITCIFQAGGLGNQLFQVAAGKSIAIDQGVEFKLLCNMPNPPQGHSVTKYRNNFFRKFEETSSIPGLTYNDPKFTYTPIPRVPDMAIHGYFQSQKYFLHNKELVLDMFYPAEESISTIKRHNKTISPDKPLVGVHVRRGDYLLLPHHFVTEPAEYYLNAMSLFPGCNFIIASDDMKWVSQNLRGSNIFYSHRTDEISDFNLMMTCDHNIISNSSFSWWAAYMNKTPGKTVVCPKKWYQDNMNIDISDLLVPEWRTI